MGLTTSVGGWGAHLVGRVRACMGNGSLRGGRENMDRWDKGERVIARIG